MQPVAVSSLFTLNDFADCRQKCIHYAIVADSKITIEVARIGEFLLLSD